MPFDFRRLRCATPLVVWVLLVSCGDKKEKRVPAETPVTVPVFQADSALHFIEKQVSFGPRVPNTRPHRETGDYLIAKLRSYGARVTVQEFQATTYDGQKLNLRNIVGSFYPQVQKRILLAAHWDTRPFADKDPENPDKPFDGANDGASGVGVLLEIARNLKTAPKVGVDIIFFDGEDWGVENGEVPLPAGLDSWWCLGSQHWAKHKQPPGYRAYYGILLDMVGGRDAQFYQEGTSVFYAPQIVKKVWTAAARMGYPSTFITQSQAPITDDHLFVNQLAEIPMINITPYDPKTGYFGTYHHTRQDNLQLMSKETLNKVGRVVTQVIYSEE
jgi:Zn-dependent M28 family amino/carboxypeptidase